MMEMLSCKNKNTKPKKRGDVLCLIQICLVLVKKPGKVILI